MFAADAAVFLETGEAVRWTNSLTSVVTTGPMLFDRPDSDMESGAIISREYQVTFETAAWPSLVIGTSGDGAGDGGSYRLRTDPRQREDGVFSAAMLSRQ